MLKKEIKKVVKEVKKIENNGKKESSGNKKNPVNLSQTYIPSKVTTNFKPFYKSTPGKNGSVRSYGADLLGVAKLSSNTVGGTVLSINGAQGPLLISPLSAQFQGSRLYVEALRFEKFRFRKLRFHYIPYLGTNSTGSVILAYDPDAADNNINANPPLQGELQALQVLMSFQDAESGSVWSPFCMDCKTVESDPQSFYYTNYIGSDIRLAAQGVLWVASGGGIGANVTLGNIAIEYEIDFYDPSMDQLNSQVQYATNAITVDFGQNKGLNGILANPTVTQATGGGLAIYPRGVDAQGNSFVVLPPGIHALEYGATTTSGGTPTAPKMNFSFVDQLSSLASSALTVLAETASGAAPNSSDVKRMKLSVGPGGSKLYGTIDPSFTGAAMNAFLNIVQWAAVAMI